MSFCNYLRVAAPIFTLALLITNILPARADVGDETTYYLLTDHLGSVDVVLNEAGEVVERRDYLPYGAERENEAGGGSAETDYKFTGKELDDETGLHYYGARYYDAEIGRFVSLDPLVLDEAKMTDMNLLSIIGNPQALNAFSYALNNPLFFVDRYGESPESDMAWGVGSLADGFVSFTVSAAVLVKGVATLNAKDAVYSQVLYLNGRDQWKSGVYTLANGEKTEITENAEIIDEKMEKVISFGSKAASGTVKFLANSSSFADGSEEMVKMYERGDDIITTTIEGTTQLIKEIPEKYENAVEYTKEKIDKVSEWFSGERKTDDKE